MRTAIFLMVVIALAAIVAVTCATGALANDDHIRKDGEAIDYFAGHTYSGNVNGTDGNGDACQMRLSMAFAFDGDSFTAQLGFSH